MLRKLRTAAAIVLLVLITFYFVDFAGLLPDGFSVLARIQFVPAIFFHSAVILAALIALTLLLGRLYCSVICPMGIFQDVVTRIGGFFRKKKKRYKFSNAKNILRYSVLGVMVIAIISGFSLVVSLLDPYAAYGRIAANLFSPVYLAGTTYWRRSSPPSATILFTGWTFTCGASSPYRWPSSHWSQWGTSPGNTGAPIATPYARSGLSWG